MSKEPQTTSKEDFETVRQQLEELWHELPNQGHYQKNYDRAYDDAMKALQRLEDKYGK